MDLTIETWNETIAKAAKRTNPVSRQRGEVGQTTLPVSCIFLVINRSAGELLAAGTPIACADLTAFGRMTTIDRKGRVSGGKRAVKTQSGGASATRRFQRLGPPP